ncbi:fatty acid hydroxylase superfamily-domain-containing protein [Apiosordaria backusii]|uniref:Fatty acid hydroxylase superfamily-domain-containing protein n=1 Tax=Apiosordaria backusii TaxID=314023 RepID=A0AA40F009_9PEZI|nr:fatty acid hydroxylase superfamily-domain-containing protein [Apiosordaria backusii]
MTLNTVAVKKHFWLSIILPHVAYWVVSLVFHLIDTYDLFPQYRLHTPEEITQRNLASRWEVARDVVLEQILQVATAAFLNLTEAKQMTGMEGYDVAVWARRIRIAQRALPGLLGLVGLNAKAISENVALGGYPLLAEGGKQAVVETVPAFATWEMVLAKAIYWVVVPGFQMWAAVAIMDTWQYFWHRAMHMNKWMYTNWHARHHRLYVPYAYGALYNHPVEGFVMDTLGAGIGYKLSFMSNRMGMLFFVGSMMKTVDDHCGYKLPWDPLQHITSNNAAYHDIHHQSWGIKSNFSQPFFTIWDRWLGTKWEGDVKLKYERTRANAAAKGEKKQHKEKKEEVMVNGKQNGKVKAK